MQPNGNGAAKFNPPVNIPQDISLKWTDGLPCQSPFNGDQVLFTLDDGRKWYLAPSDADRVRALQLGSGELFKVTRREIARGNRRSYSWEFERADVALPTPAPAAQPAHTAIQQTQPAQPQVQPSNRTPGKPSLESRETRAALAAAGTMVLDALAWFEGEAQKRGLQCQLDAGSVQDLWVSVFIDIQKRWGR